MDDSASMISKYGLNSRYRRNLFYKSNFDFEDNYSYISTIMSKKKATAISLPLSRTAKIMNSAAGVDSVSQDIVALATKATEIFLMDFARRAYDQASDEDFGSSSLEYEDIQKLVHSDPRYSFLIDTIPKRIRFEDALKLVEEASGRPKSREELTDTHDTPPVEQPETNSDDGRASAELGDPTADSSTHNESDTSDN